jgi:hypothetical protein
MNQTPTAILAQPGTEPLRPGESDLFDALPDDDDFEDMRPASMRPDAFMESDSGSRS